MDRNLKCVRIETSLESEKVVVNKYTIRANRVPPLSVASGLHEPFVKRENDPIPYEFPECA